MIALISYLSRSGFQVATSSSLKALRVSSHCSSSSGGKRRVRPSTYVFRLGAAFQIKTSPWRIDVLRMFPLISLWLARNSAASNAKSSGLISQPELDLVAACCPSR